MANPIFNGGGGNTTLNNLSSVVQFIKAFSNKQNPIAALTALNPQLMQQLRGKSPQEIEQYVRAEYAKRGVDIDAIIKQISQLNIF